MVALQAEQNDRLKPEDPTEQEDGCTGSELHSGNRTV